MQQSLERDLARRWASGELIGVPLRTTSGERLTVVYSGRPGGGLVHTFEMPSFAWEMRAHSMAM